MLYVSGIHALNIENSLETCGDWHCSALDWKSIELLDSEKSVFKEWGIETGKSLPDNDGIYNVANDLRAVADMMEKEGNLGYLKGFRNDFIVIDKYNDELFRHIWMLRGLKHWDAIDGLMEYEYLFKWDAFKKERYVSSERKLLTELMRSDSSVEIIGSSAVYFCYNGKIKPTDIKLRSRNSLLEALNKIEGVSITEKETDTDYEEYSILYNRKKYSLHVEKCDTSAIGYEPITVSGLRVGSIGTVFSESLLDIGEKNLKDMYNSCYIILKYYDMLGDMDKAFAGNILAYYGRERLLYYISKDNTEWVARKSCMICILRHVKSLK